MVLLLKKIRLTMAADSVKGANDLLSLLKVHNIEVS